MARILTTEKDSEMNQTTNINISCEPKTSVETETNVPQYPPMDCPQIYPSVQARDIQLTENINEQEKQIEFLETLLEEYRNKPVVLKGLLICKAENLMKLVKIATSADSVELILNNDISCTSCTDTKYTYLSNILITKNGQVKDFKIGYNEIYSKFIKFGVSLKIVI